ncbi:MAG: sulfurtransferase TusA family protein [Spirochaetaceae bacterium]|nr:sulfurtransferase TusA family protein [Spirochaetaceae bacterium]MDT8299353.1 sulfurtransferase TusA family protein [Spirochaetaceae bacterium]
MSDIQIDREIDLSGDVCPYTFVKSKLALEKMSSGQILAVKVDNGESASNVPRSMELENHDVLSVDEVSGGWRITVRKG